MSLKKSTTILFLLLCSFFSMAQFNSIIKLKFDIMRKKPETFLAPTTKYKKIKSTIQIPTSTGTITFKDTVYIYKDYYTRDAVTDSLKYRIGGEDTIRNWVAVVGRGENRVDYYLVHTSSGQLYKLCGQPELYDDHLLCKEITYENGDGEKIELWEIEGSDLTNCKTFYPHHEQIYQIRDLYFNSNKIYLSVYGKREFYCTSTLNYSDEDEDEDEDED